MRRAEEADDEPDPEEEGGAAPGYWFEAASVTANKEPAIPVATLPSDIAAFRHSHPLDLSSERKLAELGAGQFIIELRSRFEIFAFSAESIGEIMFDVRGIKDALAAEVLAFGMFEAPLEEGWVEHLRSNGGVERERMAALTAADLERPPIAVVVHGYTVVIDGNNRIVRRWDDGLRSVRLAVVRFDPTIGPYICRPGGEEKFMQRRSSEDPRGLTSLGMVRRCKSTS